VKKKKNLDLFGWLKKIIPTFGLLGHDTSRKTFQSIWNEEIDPFGRDPAFEDKLKPFLGFLYHKYWRTSTHGLENIPSKGRGLLVANHSGALPYDGSMLRYAISMDHPSGRDVRFLVEDFVYFLPFIGTYMYRVGGVRASRDNAERLLKRDHLVAVFPEGVKGIGKKYSERYHLQRFGRGGFIKLAIKTNSPIIPVAIIGAEEIHPIIYKSSLLAKPLGIPYVPITPTLPLLGPLGLIPLPSKWAIYFGKPIDLGKYGKKTLEDELQIHKLSEMVRQKIQAMITEALKKRRSVWWG
jgi:1-acyl-sn-glycerol-3-phosphate acyltransferase